MAGDKGFLYYKGRPLVRSGDTVYYGSMADKFVIKMDILSKKTVGSLECADKVLIQLMHTDEDVNDRVIKKSEKNGLYNAIDIASIWLERALAE